MPHMFHDLLSASIQLPKEQIHIITPHVGGGFGGKLGPCPEQTVVAALAHLLQRAVTWTATRSEDMLVLGHSRGQI